MPNQLAVAVRAINAQIRIIDVQGDLTVQAEDALMAAYNEACQGGPKAIVLNFENLDYMNSSGIGLLVTLLIRVQRQKQQLLAYGLTEHYRQIFELTRLNEAIGIYTDEAAARTAVMTAA